jgi:hypothetical protein
MSGAGTGKKGGRGVGVVKPHGRGEPCVWAEELRGWRRSLQDAPRGGKELETVEGRGSAPMRAGPRRGEGGRGAWAANGISETKRKKTHVGDANGDVRAAGMRGGCGTSGLTLDGVGPADRGG